MNNRQLILGAALLFSSFFSVAQKKLFTYDQLFKGQFPAIFKPLPQIEGWADDDHYIESRSNNNGSDISMSVDVLSGRAMPYINNKKNEPDEPSIPESMNVTLSPDARYAAYTKNNNLYVMDVASHKETALTNDGSDVILNGYASWVYYEEILGRGSHYKAFWWSPDSRHIAFMRFDDSKVPVFPIYVADGQHGHLEEERYPKAGDTNPEVKIGIIEIGKSSTVWADFNPDADQYFGTPYWTPSNQFLVQWMNRRQDSLLLYRINANDGSKTNIYTEKQSTFISLDDDQRFYFLSSNNGFIIKSDKDGWDNLYLYDENGKLINQVTSGNYWGTNILYADEKNKQLYIKARKENSARFDVYKVSMNGKSAKRLTFGNYSHDNIFMSPGGKYFITVYSGLSMVPAMAIVDNKGKIVKELGNIKGEEFDDYAMPLTKLYTVRSSDDQFDLPLTITYPIHFDSTKKYPVWITVYGGPDMGTVYERWKPSGGFNQWWAQEGLIQVTMDNRSSGHFGKKGINYIFKQLGKWETEDYMTCAKWLRSQKWVDASRIGITGGSFGGYVTCMALTYGANVFTHGIASYPVTDWQLYDSHYTERFMTTPQSNPEGYKNTSVLTYVNKYKGLLRIIHGSTDDNVHLQNTLQLINAMEERAMHFELFIYPNERHGISGAKSTHNVLETCRFIYRNMLRKDFPEEFGR
jgi:dipeptidyl-peptidase-4